MEYVRSLEEAIRTNVPVYFPRDEDSRSLWRKVRDWFKALFAPEEPPILLYADEILGNASNVTVLASGSSIYDLLKAGKFDHWGEVLLLVDDAGREQVLTDKRFETYFDFMTEKNEVRAGKLGRLFGKDVYYTDTEQHAPVQLLEISPRIEFTRRKS